MTNDEDTKKALGKLEEQGKADLVSEDEVAVHKMTVEEVASPVVQEPLNREDDGDVARAAVELVAAQSKITNLTEIAKDVEFKLGRQRKKAEREFREWKRALMEIIRTGSQLVFHPNGNYQFILPPRLVKLVWTTTIKERVKLEQQKGGADGAEVRAMKAIREEVTGAVGEVLARAEDKEVEAEQAQVVPLKQEGSDEAGKVEGQSDVGAEGSVDRPVLD